MTDNSRAGACLGFCVNTFSQKWPSRRPLNSIINTVLIFLYPLWCEGTVTIARSTQFQGNAACDNGLCGIIVKGISSRFGLIFLIPKIMCHLCIESGFNADLFQQPLKLIEVLRGFEVFDQFISQSL